MQVKTSADALLAKLDPKLEAKVKKGETASVAVFATVQGDPAAAKAVLDNARVAATGDSGLVLGSTGSPPSTTTAGTRPARKPT
jgi:hypothetical protein